MPGVTRPTLGPNWWRYATPMPEVAKKAGEAFGVPSFSSVAELIASDVGIDAASVCTAGVENGGDHYRPTMELLHAGIPVLGEKPISNRVHEAREMVALAAEMGIPYGVNLNHRFTPAARRARAWVDEGRLGEINICNMTMWINNPNESSPHFHMSALHPHSIDVMRYFCGDVEQSPGVLQKGAGPEDLVKRPGKHAVPQRCSRALDRELRCRRLLRPRNLRGGRF